MCDRKKNFHPLCGANRANGKLAGQNYKEETEKDQGGCSEEAEKEGERERQKSKRVFTRTTVTKIVPEDSIIRDFDSVASRPSVYREKEKTKFNRRTRVDLYKCIISARKPFSTVYITVSLTLLFFLLHFLARRWIARPTEKPTAQVVSQSRDPHS